MPYSLEHTRRSSECKRDNRERGTEFKYMHVHVYMCKGESSPVAKNLHILPKDYDGDTTVYNKLRTDEFVEVLVSEGTTTNAASWTHTSTQTGMIHCVTNMHVCKHT